MTFERDDAALAASAREGDERAFTELMRRHKAAIYRFVRLYSGDADEALDLVQETFVSAWVALSSYDAKRPIAAWLRAIALNKCRDWSRRRKVRDFFFRASSLDAARNIATPISVEPKDEARSARLDAALARLPAPLKEPLLLTLFEGLSHKDAAKLLGLSPKAVEIRIHRARQALQAALTTTAGDAQS